MRVFECSYSRGANRNTVKGGFGSLFLKGRSSEEVLRLFHLIEKEGIFFICLGSCPD